MCHEGTEEEYRYSFPLSLAILSLCARLAWVVNLMLIDLCIADYSVEIPTRCSFVIEFIIPKFFKGSKHVSSGTPLIISSSKLYLQPLVYMPIW